MLSDLLEKFGLAHDGKINWGRVTVPGIVFGGFILWRLQGVGTHNADGILAHLERELIDDYKIALYKKHGFFDDAAPGKKRESADRDERFPHEEFVDLDVTFSNVSMSAPLMSWSAAEDVVVRFDYTLSAGGITKQRGRDVYKRLSHLGNKVVWDSGPIEYYVHFWF